MRKKNNIGHEVLRECAQFQLCVDNSGKTPTYYIDNSILIEFTKGKGRSYNFGEEIKDMLMVLNDVDFSTEAKRRAGNDIYCLEVAKAFWGQLGDALVNEDDEIEEEFSVLNTTFDKGTDKFEIWHWFEETFNLSVAKDLMYLD